MSVAVLGDALNLIVLGLSAIYAVSVLGHGRGWWVLEAFGQNWASDGFCLSFKGTLLHTHLLCFYGDAVFTLVLLWLLRGTSRSELLGIKKGAPSVFFHGLGHAVLWVNEQYGYGPPDPAQTFFGPHNPKSLPLIAATTVATFAFWASFLCLQQGPIPLWVNLLQSVVHTIVTGWFCPVLLLFTYVTTVLSFNFGGVHLAFGLEGVKDEFYAASALLVAVPIMAATWAEPLLCDAGLVSWGGHILFDFSIPLSQLTFLAVASTLKPRAQLKAD